MDCYLGSDPELKSLQEFSITFTALLIAIFTLVKTKETKQKIVTPIIGCMHIETYCSISLEIVKQTQTMLTFIVCLLAFDCLTYMLGNYYGLLLLPESFTECAPSTPFS